MSYESNNNVTINGEQITLNGTRWEPSTLSFASTEDMIIVGSSQFAELAALYFNRGVFYNVECFLEKRKYLKRLKILGLPVNRFQERFEYIDNTFFVAISYREQNKIRADIFNQLREEGFKFTNYERFLFSPPIDLDMGDNNFIFEWNNFQPYTKIGDDNIFWSMNHIGHNTKIGNHNFIASHVVISGNVKIGDFCFFGVNATIGNDIKIADGTVVSAGAVVLHDTKPWTLYMGNPAKEYDISLADKFFNK